MNPRERIFMYGQITVLDSQGYSITSISNITGLSRPTIYKYLAMDFIELEKWANQLTQRGKKLDPYREEILTWLSENPSMSASQVEDWLREQHPNLEIGSSTVRLYVRELREIEGIEKIVKARDYAAVEEHIPGDQTQVDWGESRQRTDTGKTIKLYFIAFVLSYSRYKYVYWLDRPFKTSDAIKAHELAIQYFGGRTHSFVYDQDTLIAIDENAGEFVLTKHFRSYVDMRGFKVELCKKADPESKGKIESVVKFVKYNFADNRVFSSLEDWQDKSNRWLDRTGNYKVHSTTKQRPEKLFAKEQKQLLPAFPVTLDQNYDSSITRCIRKDNCIVYRSNRYTLPLGSYAKYQSQEVGLQIQNKMLRIIDTLTQEVLAEHVISQEKGQLIGAELHKRTTPPSQVALRQAALQVLGFTAAAHQFIDGIWQSYPRHRHEQLRKIIKVSQAYPAAIPAALEHCLSAEIYSSDALAKQLIWEAQWQKKEQRHPTVLPLGDSTSCLIDAPQRALSDYMTKLGVE